MKILLLTWKCFGNEDIESAFLKLGHTVIKLEFSDKEEPSDTEAVGRFAGQVKARGVDCVFSFNYFPVVALACKDLGLPYLSWTYDSPYVRLYHYSVAYPTNYVFVFDQSIYQEFHQAGIPTVYYLPMAANVDRLSAMQDFATFRRTGWRNRHSVAFIGSLYTEKHCFYQRLTNITDYTRGYLEGLIAAQKQVYGYNFIQEILAANPAIMEDMGKSLPMKPSNEGVEKSEYLFGQYVVNRQITAVERREILSDVSEKFGLDLYTPDKNVVFDGCTNHGPVDYYDFAPYVYKQARINLNISLRSIVSGMPLRAFDIMGAGGFLLTNYQADFMEFFVPDQDFVFYESRKDLMEKIAYYFAHEEERAEIAQNGYRKIAEGHTYQHRVTEMLSYL